MLYTTFWLFVLRLARCLSVFLIVIRRSKERRNEATEGRNLAQTTSASAQLYATKSSCMVLGAGYTIRVIHYRRRLKPRGPSIIWQMTWISRLIYDDTAANIQLPLTTMLGREAKPLANQPTDRWTDECSDRLTGDGGRASWRSAESKPAVTIDDYFRSECDVFDNVKSCAPRVFRFRCLIVHWRLYY